MNGTEGAGVLLTAGRSSTFVRCRTIAAIDAWGAPNKSMVTRSKNQCLPDLASDQNVISVQMNPAQVMAPSQNSRDGQDPRHWL